jgi:hypothetical protein
LNEKGTDVLNKRGANISNEKEDDILNKRGADILNERGADISNEKKDDISNERGADITPPRRSSWLKRKEKLPEKCLKTIAKLGVILFTSSAIVLPNTTSIQPLISLSDNAQIFPVPVQSTLPTQMEPIDKVEELRAYHSYLDKLNEMFSPDTILSHLMYNTLMMMRGGKYS